eukprot:scaffold316260_cov28-Tisochrysis_lutea.AAC.3
MHFAEGDVLTFGETGKDPRRELAELRCPSRSERARSSPLRASNVCVFSLDFVQNLLMIGVKTICFSDGALSNPEHLYLYTQSGFDAQ